MESCFGGEVFGAAVEAEEAGGGCFWYVLLWWLSILLVFVLLEFEERFLSPPTSPPPFHQSLAEPFLPSDYLAPRALVEEIVHGDHALHGVFGRVGVPLS